MKTRPAVTATATGAALAILLAACGGGTSTSGNGGGTATAGVAAFNAGVGSVFNPSDAKGGTLRLAHSGDFDSLDPADTYYAYSWNFIRLYGRSLVMFAPAPGAKGSTLVPDLAATLGVPSDNAKTWTYHLRPGVKFEDGTLITAKDVKYAVERSLDKTVFPDGPTYFNDFLDLQGYTSPYKDADPNKLGLKAIETPDDATIVFHLLKPFSGFDYFAQLPATIPVPAAKDTGANYKQHVVSSGPYKFDTNSIGKSFTLVRNDSWDVGTDPNRKALPDRIEVTLNVNADDIDNRLLSGDVDVAIEGTGLQPAAQGRVLGDPSLKKNADSAAIARLWYTSINPDVAPLDNIHCRKAVEYANDKVSYQNAYGGPAGGDIATNMMPPMIPGAQKFDVYPGGADNHGDVPKAKDELKQCGQPNGFSTTMSYRAERPREKAVAEGMQQALARVGIKLTLKGFPQSDYFKLYAGKPAYAKANNLGLMTNGWGADWPDGFGFLQQIVDSRVIRATGGNTNLSVKVPDVDKLLDQALLTTDLVAREQIWSQIDRTVMDNAVVLPGVWAKTLVYRPSNLTNVFVNDGFGMYDYLALGVKK